MSCKDLIIYILENNLENATIVSVDEAALKLYTGPATIKALIQMGKLKGLQIGDTYLVLIEDQKGMHNNDR